MRVLAFDTTTAACSVALWCDGVIEGALCDPMVHGQAEALVPNIERVLAKAGHDYSAIDRIAVTVGPGSFTGVRVGLATARGLAVATGCPIVGLATTEVLAQEAAGSGNGLPVAVAIDARRAEVYLQCFDETGRALDEVVCLLPEAAAQYLDDQAWHLVGDGTARLVPFLGQSVQESALGVPNAAVLAAIAAARPVPDHTPGPLYVRPPDAVLPKNGGRLRP